MTRFVMAVLQSFLSGTALAAPAQPIITGTEKLSQADINGFVAQVRRCFTLSREQFYSGYHPTVIFEMNSNGTVRRAVQIVSDIHSGLEKDVAIAAIHAFRNCAPYRLPAVAYDDWTKISVTFLEEQ